jgi:hypothetical protein
MLPLPIPSLPREVAIPMLGVLGQEEPPHDTRHIDADGTTVLVLSEVERDILSGKEPLVLVVSDDQVAEVNEHICIRALLVLSHNRHKSIAFLSIKPLYGTN